MLRAQLAKLVSGLYGHVILLLRIAFGHGGGLRRFFCVLKSPPCGEAMRLCGTGGWARAGKAYPTIKDPYTMGDTQASRIAEADS
jgi:hypothetical protein